MRKLLLSILLIPTAVCQVTTAQYDNARTGADLHETILTPRNVNVDQFGKVFTLAVDGDVYAQPLYLPQIDIAGKGRHNVVFIATEHDSVYAFDADQPGPPLWRVNFLDPRAGVTTVDQQDVRCFFIAPEIGITPTPVIDTASGTIYVLARTKEHERFYQRLHALDITTGREKFGGPRAIEASMPGRGWFSGTISFGQLHENPRSALLLDHGRIYIAWASSCDVRPYYGWVMAYDARTLKQVGVFNASPEGQESGVWQGDAGIAADENGNVYAVTGNGVFTAASGGRDYGDTVLKLRLGPHGLEVGDYFTPSNERQLNAQDNDLGGGGPVLLPDQPGAHRRLLVVAGKGATIYLIDRDRMGKFQSHNDSHAVEALPHAAGESAFGAPAYWNGHLYFLAGGDVLKDWPLENGRLASHPAASGTERFADSGATPAVSADGSKDGIVWALSSKGWRSMDLPAVLHAYEAANVAHELYASNRQRLRDGAGDALRFAIPTIANGRVYVGAKNEVDVYGLLAGTAPKKRVSGRR